LQLGSGAIPSVDEVDIEMIDDAPIPRSRQMSEDMKTRLQCGEVRIDQAVALLEKTVAANTYTVRIKDMVRTKAEGKTLLSVIQIMEEYDGPDQVEYYGRYVMIEFQKMKDRKKCRIDEIEVITTGAS
jgi:hypothetical protein